MRALTSAELDLVAGGYEAVTVHGHGDNPYWSYTEPYWNDSTNDWSSTSNGNFNDSGTDTTAVRDAHAGDGHAITVNFFVDGAGGLGHIGMSIDGGPSLGFYPKNSDPIGETLYTVQGELKQDFIEEGSDARYHSVTFSLGDGQATAVANYVLSHQDDAYTTIPNTYADIPDAYNCATFVENALAAGGVFASTAQTADPDYAFLEIVYENSNNNETYESHGF